VGREETIAASIASVRKGKTVTLIGNISPEVKIPPQIAVSRQVPLQGSCASSGEYSACHGTAGQRENKSKVVDYRGNCETAKQNVLS
jgi:threonine dehydrogenase-like Zn-dependent dehydrogenase